MDVLNKWGEKMSRYIDVDDVANAIYHHFPSVRTMADARSVIEEVPTIEAVSVVRCEDCKRSEGCDQMVLISEIYNEVEEAEPITYCSYGERKESE